MFFLKFCTKLNFLQDCAKQNSQFFSFCHFAIIYIKNKRIIIIVTNFHTQNLYLS